MNLELIGLIIAILGLCVALYNMINILYEKYLIRREDKELQDIRNEKKYLHPVQF